MVDDGTDIARLEARIDALRDEIEYCRKAILISRVAVVAGGLSTVAAFLGLYWSAPLFFLSIAAVIGGLIGMGANRTTRDQAKAELAERQAERNLMIDALTLRPFA